MTVRVANQSVLGRCGFGLGFNLKKQHVVKLHKLLKEYYYEGVQKVNPTGDYKLYLSVELFPLPLRLHYKRYGSVYYRFLNELFGEEKIDKLKRRLESELENLVENDVMPLYVFAQQNEYYNPVFFAHLGYFSFLEASESYFDFLSLYFGVKNLPKELQEFYFKLVELLKDYFKGYYIRGVIDENNVKSPSFEQALTYAYLNYGLLHLLFDYFYYFTVLSIEKTKDFPFVVSLYSVLKRLLPKSRKLRANIGMSEVTKELYSYDPFPVSYFLSLYGTHTLGGITNYENIFASTQLLMGHSPGMDLMMYLFVPPVRRLARDLLSVDYLRDVIVYSPNLHPEESSIGSHRIRMPFYIGSLPVLPVYDSEGMLKNVVMKGTKYESLNNEVTSRLILDGLTTRVPVRQAKKYIKSLREYTTSENFERVYRGTKNCNPVYVTMNAKSEFLEGLLLKEVSP